MQSILTGLMLGVYAVDLLVFVLVRTVFRGYVF